MTGHESKRVMAQDNITDEQGRPMTYWGGKAQPALEPVAAVLLDDMVEGIHPSYGRGLFTTDNCVRKLYNAPPQRKPLTEQEIWDAVQHGVVGSIGFVSKAVAVARAIEAAHGIQPTQSKEAA